MISISIKDIFDLIKILAKKIKYRNIQPNIKIIDIPLYDGVKCGEIKLFNAIWEIRAPVPSSPPFLLEQHDFLINPEEIEIVVPPRCPKCRTELEEKERKILFWRKYKWICVGCGFRTNSKESYYIVADKVKRIVKRQIELRNEKLAKQGL